MQLSAFRHRAVWRNRTSEQIGTTILLVASLLVGIAIVSPDPFSRAINGLSGILWIVGAALLLKAVRDDPRFWRRLAAVAVIGLVLVIVIRPSDLRMAGLGFGAAGALIAGGLGARGLAWAKVLPALWLPEHLLTAVTRAFYRSVRDLPATIRSEPPPTAALVPFTMVAATIGAASIVTFFRQRSRSRAPEAERNPSPPL